MVVMSKLCVVAGLIASANVGMAVEKCEQVEFNVAEQGKAESLKEGTLCADAVQENGQVTVTVDLTMSGRSRPVYYGFELPSDAYVAVKLDADGEEDPASDSKLVALGTKGLDKDACKRTNGDDIKPCVFTRRYPLQSNFPVGRCTRKRDYEALLEEGNGALLNKNVCRLATEEKGYTVMDPTMEGEKLQFTLAPGVPLPSPLNVVFGGVVAKNSGDVVAANGDEFGNSMLMEVEVDGTLPPTEAPTLPPSEPVTQVTDAPTTTLPTTPPTTEEPATAAPSADSTEEPTAPPSTSVTTEPPTDETSAPTAGDTTSEPSATVPPTLPPSVVTAPPTFTEETLAAQVMDDGVLTYTVKEDGVVDVAFRMDNQPSFSGFLAVGVSETGQMVGAKALIGTMGGGADGVEQYDLQGKRASDIVQISRRLLKQEDCGTETVFVQDGDSIILEFCASQIGGEPLVDENGKLRKLVVARGFDPQLQSAHPASGRTTFDTTTAKFIDDKGPRGKVDDDDDGISGGAVAGIVIGVLALVAIAVAGVAHSKSNDVKEPEQPKDFEKQNIPAKTEPTPPTQGEQQQVYHQ